MEASKGMCICKSRLFRIKPGLHLFIYLSMLMASSVFGCQICLPMPTESLADRIIDSDHLLLAREHPSKAYQIESIHTLKGNPSEVSEIDIFLDSSTRRKLTLDSNLSLLCGWTEEQKDWRRLALYDDSLAPVVSTILERSESWKINPDERLSYFAGFLAHEDSELSDLAHLEVAGAPYSKLLQYADRMPTDLLHEKLRNLRRMEWHALYILFLSQSENQRDHDYIREGLQNAARYNLARRAAPFATALIEIDGDAGIKLLSDLYLSEPGRRPEEIAAIYAALKVHGNEGRPELRDSIVNTYEEILKLSPALAPDIADDLTHWKRFNHTDALSKVLTEQSLDLAATARIRSHLKAAQEAVTPAQGKNDSPGPLNMLAIIGALLLLPLVMTLNKWFKTPQPT